MIRNSRRVVAFAIAGAVAIAPVLSGCGAGQEPQTAAPTRLTEAVNAYVPADKPANAHIEIRNLFVLGPKPGQSFGSGSDLPLYAALINQVKAQDQLTGVEAPDFEQVKITGGAVTLPPARPSGEGVLTTLVGDSAAAAASPSGSPSGSAKPTDKKSAKPGDSPSPNTTGSPNATGSPTARPTGNGSPAATPEPTGQGATPTASGSPSAPSSNTASPAAEPAPVPSPGKAPLVVLTGLKRQLLGGETIKVTLRFQNAGSITLTVPVIPQQNEYASYAAVSNGTPLPGASAESEKTDGGGHHPRGEEQKPEHGGTPAPSSPAPGAPAGH
ncbi:hypothetical protein GCM10009678_62920 [Actinomadura kijaniata]|uniref:Copper(I)-binding protein n=1 Tax=Actinomadura namibiensis TaxID=182080 RepID=A0A7W3LWR4_ACTNM|nr:hypothetical protein [Actinomadura namibiensis]MBA8955667.1 copper(I)-binding protein [Actinomadura namibiensis]